MLMLQVLAVLGGGLITPENAAANQGPVTRLEVQVMTKFMGNDLENIRKALIGTWHVQDLSTGPVPEGQQITLEFDDTKMVAKTPCNHLVVTYDLSDDVALFGPVESTQAENCSEEQIETERRLRYELGRVQRLEISQDGELRVFVADLEGFRAIR